MLQLHNTAKLKDKTTERKKLTLVRVGKVEVGEPQNETSATLTKI